MAAHYNVAVRVRVLRRLLWVLGFGCLWLPVCDDPPLRTEAYLQDVTARSAVVAMIAPAPVQLRCDVLTEDGVSVAAVTSAGERRRHNLQIAGLQPATRYRYQVVGGQGEVLSDGDFCTAPEDDAARVRFAFVGDSGGQPWWVWLQRAPLFHLPARWQWLPTDAEVTQIGARIAAYEPDFLLHLGDVVYPNGKHCHYSSGFFRPFADVLRRAPVYAVLGNHDVMEADGVQFLANFKLPAADVTGDGRMFSMAWGPVRIVGLDCNPYFGGGLFGPEHPAHAFLRHELATRTEPWIIVATHFPMRSGSRQMDRGDLLVSMLPMLQEWGASLYLSGHDHCYQRFGGGLDGSLPLIVSGGGGKSLYEVRPHPRAAVLQPQYHWCAVEAGAGMLTVRAHSVEGALIDTVQVPLSTGEALERIRLTNPGRAGRIEALARR